MSQSARPSARARTPPAKGCGRGEMLPERRGKKKTREKIRGEGRKKKKKKPARGQPFRQLLSTPLCPSSSGKSCPETTGLSFQAKHCASVLKKRFRKAGSQQDRSPMPSRRTRAHPKLGQSVDWITLTSRSDFWPRSGGQIAPNRVPLTWPNKRQHPREQRETPIICDNQ